MRSSILSVVVALSLASSAYAQESDRVDRPTPPDAAPGPRVDEATVEAALQRLEQREQESKKRAAEQPGGNALSTDPRLMREEIVRLRHRVQELARENQALRARIVQVAGDNPELHQLITDMSQAAEQTERDFELRMRAIYPNFDPVYYFGVLPAPGDDRQRIDAENRGQRPLTVPPDTRDRRLRDRADPLDRDRDDPDNRLRDPRTGRDRPPLDNTGRGAGAGAAAPGAGAGTGAGAGAGGGAGTGAGAGAGGDTEPDNRDR